MNSIFARTINLLHRPFRKSDAKDPYHGVLGRFVSLSRSLPSPRILEIGSWTSSTDVSLRSLFPTAIEYVGFDIRRGHEVDVVGDAHNLSSHFSRKSFDLVISVSVFEHLLFPWKVVLEMNKVMRSGAYVYLSTHPTWPAHEQPCDFWRFQEHAFAGLFNEHTGFELVSVVEGLPCKAYSLVDRGPTLPVCLYAMNQGVAVIAKKVADYREDLLRWDISAADVVNTKYPGSDLPRGTVREAFAGPSRFDNVKRAHPDRVKRTHPPG